MMTDELRFLVPAMTCAHCVRAVSDELGALTGVHTVDVDLDSKVVAVTGEGLSWVALAEAVDEAGYVLVRR